MRKDNAQKCREYRQKKKQNKIKKFPKTSTQRVREYRERLKALANVQHNKFITRNSSSTVTKSENDHSHINNKAKKGVRQTVDGIEEDDKSVIGNDHPKNLQALVKQENHEAALDIGAKMFFDEKSNPQPSVADSIANEKILDAVIKLEPPDAILCEEPIAINAAIVKYEVLEFGETEESSVASPGIQSLIEQKQNDTEEIVCNSVVSDETCVDEEDISNAASTQNSEQPEGSKDSLDKNVNNRPYKCPQCSKDFASKYALYRHSNIHTERQRSYQCDMCDKAFLRKQNLNKHRPLHFGVKLFPCEICSKNFSTHHNLLAHKIIHSGDKPFNCRTCNRGFARRAELKDHERIHTGERPFKCDNCLMTFVQRWHLKSHVKSQCYLNENRYKCEHCERTFHSQRRLDCHIQSKHTGESPNKCENCGAFFAYPAYLKRHMGTCLGPKSFACETCGQQFRTRYFRNSHRCVKSDKKPYECLECGASFTRKHNLLAHIKLTKHRNGAIVVNQPEISLNNGATAGKDDDDMLKETVSTFETTDTIENIAGVSGQVIKEEVEDIKYLKFEEQKHTWVYIDD